MIFFLNVHIFLLKHFTLGKGGGGVEKWTAGSFFKNTFLKTFLNTSPPWAGFNEGLNAHERDYNPASSVTITSLFMLVFIIFNGQLEGPKKNSKYKLFPKGRGGGQPQSLHLIKSIFWRIDKISKIDFKKFAFWGGAGGRSRPIWKKFTFGIFFWTLLLLSSGTQKALLDMKLNIHLIKRQNQTFLKIYIISW